MATNFGTKFAITPSV